MPLTLYYFETSSPVRSVDLVIRALDLSPEYNTVNLFENEHLEAKFLKINPLHTVPVIDDDGFILWESRAIMTYLVSQYGKDDTLYPKDNKKRALVDQKLHYSNDVFFVVKQITKGLVIFKQKIIPPELLVKVTEIQTNVEKFLESHTFIAGDSLTVADYSYITLMDIIEICSPLDHKFPLTSKWMDRCRSTMKDFDKVNKKGVEQLASLVKNALSS